MVAAKYNIPVVIMSAHRVPLLARLVQAITFSTRWKVVLVTLVVHLAMVQATSTTTSNNFSVRTVAVADWDSADKQSWTSQLQKTAQAAIARVAIVAKCGTF